MRFIRPLILPVCVLLIWEIAPLMEWVPSVLLPPAHRVFTRLFEQLPQIVFWDALWNTLGAAVLGLALGTAIGILIGAAAGISSGFAQAVTPSIDFARAVPVVLWVPIAVLLFGLGYEAKIALATLVTSLYVSVATAHAAAAVDQFRIFTVRVRGARTWKTLRLVVLPEIFDAAVIGGARIGATLALAVVLIMEMLFSSSQGLGTLIMDARLAGDYERSYALIVVAGVLGYALNVAARGLGRLRDQTPHRAGTS